MFSEIWRNLDITELWIEENGVPVSFQVGDQEQNYLRVTARAIPTKKHWLAWASWAAQQNWKQCGKFAHLRLSNQESRPLRVFKVTVRHLYLDFNGATGFHTAREYGSYAVEHKNEGIWVAP